MLPQFILLDLVRDGLVVGHVPPQTHSGHIRLLTQRCPVLHDVDDGLHQNLILMTDLVLPLELVLDGLRVLLEVGQAVAARRGRVRDRADLLDSSKEGSYLFFFPRSRDGVLGRVDGRPSWPPPHVSCCEERGGGVAAAVTRVAC